MKSAAPLPLGALSLALAASWARAHSSTRIEPHVVDVASPEILSEKLRSELVDQRALSIVLGQPTDRSIVVSVMASDAREAYVEYGPAHEGFTSKSKLMRLTPNRPSEFTLDRLSRDTEYQYRLCMGSPRASKHPVSRSGTFRTQRGHNEGFTFEIESDMRANRADRSDPLLQARSIRAAIADRPDFLVAIGDGGVPTAQQGLADEIERRQRRFLGLIGRTAPVFLVGGSQKALFPRVTSKFYAGDGTHVAGDFAWKWGDAQFVVADLTKSDVHGRWLQRTLRSSRSKFKFVFSPSSPSAEAVRELMARGDASILFDGLNRFFVKDARGDVVFHDLPTGESQNIAGRTRVHVSPSQVRVEYVRVNSDQKANSEIAYAFNLTG